MENITFCIPFYGKTKSHHNNLKICIERIRLYYPINKIFVCKTSDTEQPAVTDPHVTVFNTFIDGSHVFGAIELLLRENKNENFLICHDSMFMIAPLPERVLKEEYYSLWHFENYREDQPVEDLIKNMNFTENEKYEIVKLYGEFPIKWCGIMGSAFGGSMDFLRNLFYKININIESIKPYTGRAGIMMSERIFALIVAYLGGETITSLNGSIFEQPHAFDISHIPNLENIKYEGSSFFKIWQGRG